jgi:hypothetical protein
LTWRDTYYADEQIEVIAVFDVDCEKVRRSMWCQTMYIVPFAVFYGIIIFNTPTDSSSSSENVVDAFGFFWFGYSMFITAMLVHQVKKASNAVCGLHVAVTTKGILKNMNRFPYGNMFRTTMLASSPPSFASLPTPVAFTFSNTCMSLSLSFSSQIQIPYDEIKVIKKKRSKCGGWCGDVGGTVLVQSSMDNTWTEIHGLTDNSDTLISLVNAMISRNASIVDDVEEN